MHIGCTSFMKILSSNYLNIVSPRLVRIVSSHSSLHSGIALRYASFFIENMSSRRIILAHRKRALFCRAQSPFPASSFDKIHTQTLYASLKRNHSIASRRQQLRIIQQAGNWLFPGYFRKTHALAAFAECITTAAGKKRAARECTLRKVNGRYIAKCRR